MNIILASASPRRRALLEMLGVRDLHVMPALGEEASCTELSPQETVSVLSYAKAKEVSDRCRKIDLHGVIIAADTVVATGNCILGNRTTNSMRLKCFVSCPVTPIRFLPA